MIRCWSLVHWLRWRHSAGRAAMSGRCGDRLPCAAGCGCCRGVPLRLTQTRGGGFRFLRQYLTAAGGRAAFQTSSFRARQATIGRKRRRLLNVKGQLPRATICLPVRFSSSSCSRPHAVAQRCRDRLVSSTSNAVCAPMTQRPISCSMWIRSESDAMIVADCRSVRTCVEKSGLGRSRPMRSAHL